MVTQRITHKIVYGFVQFDSCLGAAGIDVVGIFYQLACGNEILVQTLSRAFYHRDASWMQNTLYGYPGLRFKMIPDDKLIHHFGGNRTVSHHYFVQVIVDECRIRHESCLAGQCLGDEQSKDGLQVSFTSGRDAPSSFSRASARHPVVPNFSINEKQERVTASSFFFSQIIFTA